MLLPCYCAISQNVASGSIKALLGKFSVSPTKQVRFSRGNLQYQASTKAWRFATNQFDFLGMDNCSISPTLWEWVDLFGWSSSTNNFGVTNSKNDKDYSGNFLDWGKGLGEKSKWFTLSGSEIDYMLNGRKDADQKNFLAIIIIDEDDEDYVPGLVILPDDWVLPEEFENLPVDYEYSDDGRRVYDLQQWRSMEKAGAVFLPAAGQRNGSSVGQLFEKGYYWLSGKGKAINDGSVMGFDSVKIGQGTISRRAGLSVRLVISVE